MRKLLAALLVVTLAAIFGANGPVPVAHASAAHDAAAHQTDDVCDAADCLATCCMATAGSCGGAALQPPGPVEHGLDMVKTVAGIGGDVSLNGLVPEAATPPPDR